MRKYRLISVFVFFISLSLSAQVKITNQPGDKYFDEVKAECADKLPSQQVLLAQKPTTVVSSIMDTLKKYDWYMLGGYNYTDKQYDNYFASEIKKLYPCQKLKSRIQLLK